MQDETDGDENTDQANPEFSPPTESTITPDESQDSGASQESQTPDEPQESNEPQEPQKPQEEPPAPSSEASPSQVVSSSKPKHGRRKTWVIIVVILLLAAAAVIIYALQPASTKTQQAVNTKKDIPYFTYGDNGADLSQEYPLDSEITVNTQVDTQLFEGLVQYQQLTKIAPLLATSWSNPNDTTWVFNLRHGVKFHSGRTMTATDVKYSLDYAVAHQNDNDQGNFTALASTIKQVAIVNPYEVKVTTDGPDPVLLNRLTQLYILDSKSQVTDFNDGTGPYVIKPGTKPTASDLYLTAFSGYWGGHVYTRNLHFQIVSDVTQLVSRARQGKYNLAGDFKTGELGGFPKHQNLLVPDLGTTNLYLNTLHSGSPFQSLQARQAIAYAIDKQAFMKAAGINGQPADQIIPESITGHDPSIKAVAYDPAKAKQLLASVANVNQPFTLLYAGDDQTPAYKLLVSELNAVGFNITLKETDFNTVLDQGLGGQADMWSATTSTNTLDGADLVGQSIISTDYTNPQVDSLLAQANTLNAATRLAALQKISQIAAKDLPVIPLVNQTRIYTSFNPSYNIEINIPSAEAGVYFWQTYQK